MPKGERLEQNDSAGVAVRRLMRRCDRVALGTIEREGGMPYVSLAMVALDHDATPLLYLSDLADHTKNLKVLPRVSLLFDGTDGHGVPLAGERATLQGEAEPVDDARLLARYVARHPDAALYAGFGDFRIHRVRIERAHLVAGFGRIHWIDGADLLLDPRQVAWLAEGERRIVEHMNEDHQDAIQHFAEALLRRDGTGWRMTGFDPDGCDLRRGAEWARLPFAAPVADREAARDELVRLARRPAPEAAP